MLISKAADIEQRKTLKNCTRNLCIIKKLPCHVLSIVEIIGFYFLEADHGQAVMMNSEQYVVMHQESFYSLLGGK